MKTKRQKLIKDLDTLWSKAVRERDGECLLCLKRDTLQAHHWIVPRARSLKHRWDIRNGTTLCYTCHMFKIHACSTLDNVERLKEVALRRSVIDEKGIEEVKGWLGTTKYGIGDLERMIEEFENE